MTTVRTAIALALLTLIPTAALRAQQPSGDVPTFAVDPYWPKPLPNDWTFGEFAGITVDSDDHIWVIQRPRTLGEDETYLLADPPIGDCCQPAPPVMEFDQEGNLVQAWGGTGEGYDWPENEHGIYVDDQGNVWIGGNGGSDHHILKFTRNGEFLLQIGRPGQSAGSNDTENLNRPSKMQVSEADNEVFVSDGYQNRRVIVFDADSGAYKRHWGAYGSEPEDGAPRTLVPEGPGPRQFNLVHGIILSTDGRVYASDRLNNRVQEFTLDGTFVKESFIRRETLGNGTAYDLDLSSDPDERFVYVADGVNNHVWILERESLEVVGRFGRQGRYAGQFHHVHSIAVDLSGNIYTAETQGKRVQRFLFEGLNSD